MAQTNHKMKLERASWGYVVPALGISIRKIRMGGTHTAVGHVWWEVQRNDRCALFQSLDDVRVWLFGLADQHEEFMRGFNEGFNEGVKDAMGED